MYFGVCKNGILSHIPFFKISYSLKTLEYTLANHIIHISYLICKFNKRHLPVVQFLFKGAGTFCKNINVIGPLARPIHTNPKRY